MALVPLTKKLVAGTSPLDTVNLEMVAGATGADQNSVVYTGREIIVLRNSHASINYDFVMHAPVDPRNNRPAVAGAYFTKEIPFGEIHFFTPQDEAAWKFSDGTLRFAVENAAVLVAVIDMVWWKGRQS